MKLYVFGSVLIFSLTSFGCTPRAHINEDTGLSLKRVLSLQNSVRPQSKLAPLSAVDSKIIMANHVEGHSKNNGKKQNSSSAKRSASVGSGEASFGSRPKAAARRME